MSLTKLSKEQRRARFLFLIEKHGLSIEDLCRLLYKSQSTIYHWKSGDREVLPESLRLLELELSLRAGKR